MKIAVSANGNDLESLLDPLFGRCPCFIIVDTDDLSFEAFDNPNVSAGQEAGIKSARFIASKGVKIIITGKCGPKAVKELSDSGIEIIVGLMGTVKQVIERFNTGDLLRTDRSNVEAFYGKHNVNPIRENQDRTRDDLGDHSNNKPWYGYIRLQQEGPGESKGDKS